ncbi:2-oxoglutarate dehydrogenase, E2 component, dihydrolipoamide succinyltransferase [Arthrobacter antibioticus]|uniref:2-oxoglutarate dehydrogenase, E2 component, dihydrolipoamide succinyltransferase n=1 Tax=Arthrobacter sp. H35-MC1 TaxID=3046203 RepID=UPI0024BA17B9|nr:2-oxoglutarate dehydrogenase, E2 component, dihydrolipoamide succinyltransferase [Arthrobacter sp. H35-MC1]MDJ0318908.1 2-oxoglutarate dehydrogenase, E2 component, dihydrolipoamide succinyltransferase [Arthrobacter sp. H35-MC1]
MTESVLLPALGESVTEGTVTRWLKVVGDTVSIDDPLVEVSTDKVDTEIPSPFEGILQSIVVAEDEVAEVGSVLAIIGSADSTLSTDSGTAPAAEPVATPAAAPVATPAAGPPADRDSLGGFPANRPRTASASLTPPAETQAPPALAGSATYVTPLVRKLARQHGVDLATVSGTGVGSRIRRSDVTAAAAAASPPEPSAAVVPPAPTQVPKNAPVAGAPASANLRGTVVKAPRIRSVIAKRMRESLDTSTQLTQVHEVDVSAIVRLRARAKESFAAANGVNLTYLPFIAQAVAEALKVHPMLNASFDEAAGNITYHDGEHLAFAVDAPKGLLVPVVRNAGTLNLAGLAAGIADVAARTRDGSITADELSGGTFSITNIGSVGALFDTPIINAPQVGILGVGAIVKRAVVVTGPDGDDLLAIRHMMYLCLTYDHRLVDGADAGRFLQTVRMRLEGAAFQDDLGL